MLQERAGVALKLGGEERVGEAEGGKFGRAIDGGAVAASVDNGVWLLRREKGTHLLLGATTEPSFPSLKRARRVVCAHLTSRRVVGVARSCVLLWLLD